VVWPTIEALRLHRVQQVRMAVVARQVGARWARHARSSMAVCDARESPDARPGPSDVVNFPSTTIPGVPVCAGSQHT